MTNNPEPAFDREAEAALSELMDDYASDLVEQVVAEVTTVEGTVAVSADDLRAAAQSRDNSIRDESSPPATPKEIGAPRRQDVAPVVLGATQYLRLGLAAGLLLVAVSATVVGGTLLPDVIQNTTARIWTAVGLAGALLASTGSISLYVVRIFGEDAIGGFLRWLTSGQGSRRMR